MDKLVVVFFIVSMVVMVISNIRFYKDIKRQSNILKDKENIDKVRGGD